MSQPNLSIHRRYAAIHKEKHNMPAKKIVSAPTDPLAGLPVGNAPGISARAAAPSATVVPIAEARSRSKRRRLTGEEFKNARDFARKATGYDASSPIWGMKMLEVLTDIERTLEDAKKSSAAGFVSEVDDHLEHALLFNQELQKRIATNQLIGAQNH